MRNSPFVRDLLERKAEVLGLAFIVVMSMACWLIFDRQAAFCFAWGTIWGIIIFLVLADRRDDHNTTVIDAEEFEEAQRDPRVKKLLAEADRYGLKIRQDDRKPFLEEILEEMVGEIGVDKAKSTYEVIKKAADDPYNDTGWDEPWAEAIEAAFNHAIEVVEEREREKFYAASPHS